MQNQLGSWIKLLSFDKAEKHSQQMSGQSNRWAEIAILKKG